MKKMKLIRNLGAASLALSIVSLIILIIFMVSSSSLWIIFGSLTFSVSAIISLVAAIMILTTDFENTEANSSKMLWGILSIFLLGPIAVLVFTGKNMKNLNDSEDDQNNVVENNSTSDSKVKTEDLTSKVDTITKAFKLFEDGVITQEEFDKIKAKNLK